MAEQIFFPVVPVNMSWEDWNGNLILYFGTEPIGHSQEDNWKIVAKNVSQLPRFEVYPVPDPDLFDKWDDWAYQFTMIINGPTK
jgi:hypothetical protein